MLLPRSASRGNSAWIFSMVQGSALPARLPEARRDFRARQVRKDLAAFRHQADAEFCDFVRRQAAHFLAREADRARARRRQPMMERMVVVLPMPLRPIRATISPA
jgi:hypothetical protein